LSTTVKTKFPLTVKLLRCQDEGLTSREGRQWTDMITDLIAQGRANLVGHTVASLQRHLWLFPEDPVWDDAQQRHLWSFAGTPAPARRTAHS